LSLTFAGDVTGFLFIGDVMKCQKCDENSGCICLECYLSLLHDYELSLQRVKELEKEIKEIISEGC
jgi:hypothetical protein